VPVATAESGPGSRSRRLRQWGPPAVSVAILAILLARFDLRAAAAALDARAGLVLLTAVLVYVAFTLTLEAVTLQRLLPEGDRPLDLATAARIRAASYLVAVVHYALGLGAVTLLVRRRTGLEVGVAAGVALLIAAIDLGILIGFVVVAIAAGGGSEYVRGPIVVGAGLALVAGFALVRTPADLGPLERIRSLGVFQAVATAPIPRLAEALVLRTAFVASFIAVVGAALAGFGVRVPLGELVVGVAAVALVAALPIAASGLGTGQAAFLWVFRGHGPPEVLLACSLALSAGLIALRALIGAAFAREYAREATAAVKAQP